MGSSHTSFRGYGFWDRDAQIEVWLYLPAQEAGEEPGRPAWLEEARRDWLLQATVGFVGCVSASLDEHLGTGAGRVPVALALSRRARDRPLGWAPAIPRDVANSFRTGGGGSVFTTDLSIEPMMARADVFIALLRGELRSDPMSTWAL
ncbi:hypothetical protein ACFYXS_27185 [Streptomyces sp. NPDC002574]|uniref:hypothetical protein n=1 Tax=Streptomyces sp. NPDC002574 TaxID=3364652 RepID=UPI00368A9B0E